MVLFVHIFLVIAYTALSLANVEAKTVVPKPVPRPVERPLRIGSFNIQNLGKSKSQDETSMDTVTKILLRYDLVLVQEIVTTDETVMDNLLDQMNKEKSSGNKYLMTISDRLGRGTAKEQYAFLYRSDKVKFLGGHVFPDKNDDFMRPPYIVHFSTPTIRDVPSLLAIGIHTQPKYAANETSALARVYDYAAKYYKVKDAVIMGDMNAGCANVRISDWESIDLWTRSEFTWLITHGIDTTISTNCCPYDRFVIAGSNMEEAVIWESIGIFDFRDAFGLDTPQALAVSDHWPIEFELKGTISDAAEENLRSTLCLTVDDIRKHSLPPVLTNSRTTIGFKIHADKDSVLLVKSSPDLKDLMASLESLKKKYPGLFSNESLSAISYKVTSGALDDATSHQELMEEEYISYVEFDRIHETTEISVCTETSIN